MDDNLNITDSHRICCQTLGNLNIQCREIKLNSNELNITISTNILNNFDALTINGIRFEKVKYE